MTRDVRSKRLARAVNVPAGFVCLLIGTASVCTASCAQLLGAGEAPSFPDGGADAEERDGAEPKVPVPEGVDGGDDGGGVFEGGAPLELDGGTTTPAGTPGVWCTPFVNDGGYALCRDFDNDTDAPSGLTAYATGGTVTVIAGAGGKVMSARTSSGGSAYVGYTAPSAARAVFTFAMSEVNPQSCSETGGVAQVSSGSASLGLAYTAGSYVAYYCAGGAYRCGSSGAFGTPDGSWSNLKLELSSRTARVSLLNASGVEVDSRGWSTPAAVGQSFTAVAGLANAKGDCNWLFDNLLLETR